MKLKQAATFLEDCERSLRKLVADAVAEGDYASVERITVLAKAVGALAAEASAGTAPAAGAAPNVGMPEGESAGRTGRRAQARYPRFFRRGEELVKVGWSKKDRKEYNHRANRRAIDSVAAAVKQIGAKGRVFTGDKLLPLKDPADGSRVPDYQAYVALAWLKDLGIVNQLGRKSGYRLAAEQQVEATITTAWAGLEEWRG